MSTRSKGLLIVDERSRRCRLAKARPHLRSLSAPSRAGRSPSGQDGAMETTGTGEVEAALREALGDGPLVVDPDVMAGYAIDRATPVKPGRPLAVVRARDTSDVQAVLRVATRFGVPVVPRGAGHRAVRGVDCARRRITLSTERMRSLSIDPAAMVATVGPGIRNAELKAAAAASTGSGTRPTRRRSRSARSAGTWPPTPAGCAA